VENAETAGETGVFACESRPRVETVPDPVPTGGC
jgi:hypothetical protein